MGWSIDFVCQCLSGLRIVRPMNCEWVSFGIKYNWFPIMFTIESLWFQWIPYGSQTSHGVGKQGSCILLQGDSNVHCILFVAIQ